MQMKYLVGSWNTTRFNPSPFRNVSPVQGTFCQDGAAAKQFWCHVCGEAEAVDLAQKIGPYNRFNQISGIQWM